MAQPEFIALIAMLFATIAFSIDAMLPALGTMAAELSPGSPNRVQLVVTAFVLGMGAGTFIVGPLSDRFGRKPVVLGGAALYCVSAMFGAVAESLEALLVARMVQGFGAAGPRIVALAVVRDLYSGAAMARILSLVIMVFTLVPAAAPTLGAGIMALVGWRGIFAAFVTFSIVGAMWFALRQPETLPVANRRSLRLGQIGAGVREVLTHPISGRATLVQALCFATLLCNLSTTHAVFVDVFERGARFHLWFALIALASASATIMNATVVERFGMRRLVRTVLATQVLVTGLYLLSLGVLERGGGPAFALYLVWMCGVFCQISVCMGNLNALAMGPMSHMAGLAASVIGALGTVLAVCIAVPIGLAYDGSILPMALGTWVLSALGLAVALKIAEPHVGT